MTRTLTVIAALLALLPGAWAHEPNPVPGLETTAPDAAVAAEAAQPPQLVVEPMMLDLGTVEEGGEVSGTFVLRNTGGSLLTILDAKPG